MTNAETPEFWQNNEQPIAVAHRGGDAAGVDKENSLAAFQAAYDLGYRWFETDVVPTKTGDLLAIHGRGYQLHPNKDLPSRMRIQRMTTEEVKHGLTIGGEPALFFEDLLSTFPDAYWFIDPKVAAAVKPLAETLKQKSRDIAKINVGAFSQGRTSAVAAEVKEATGRDICTALGPLGAFAILGASNVEFGSLEPRDRVVYQVLKSLKRLPPAEMAVSSTGATNMNIPYRWVNNSNNLVELAHELGLHIAVWTPNSAGDISQSLDKGADAVMSDRVQLLKDVIAGHDKQ